MIEGRTSVGPEGNKEKYLTKIMILSDVILQRNLDLFQELLTSPHIVAEQVKSWKIYVCYICWLGEPIFFL